jgi:hypothetical protein
MASYSTSGTIGREGLEGSRDFIWLDAVLNPPLRATGNPSPWARPHGGDPEETGEGSRGGPAY